jgi:drug/metabolite transporter (DMT)-like permease
MDSSRRDRSIGFLCLVVTAFGWALNWPLMKLLLLQWPPLFARGLAGVLAGVILAALALGRGQSLIVPRQAIPRLLFASFTNVFAWMGFGTMAMKYVTVGEGALIAYTMPIWAMLFAWPLLHVRPTLRDVAALVLGILGVALLLGADGFSFSDGKLIGIALALSCAILFALGNVLNREALPMPPLVVVAWQVGLGCAVMLLLGTAFEHPNVAAITPQGIACFVYMTLVPMGLCYLTWFETLRRLPPTSASTGMLLVPVIGVVSAAFILGEPLGLREVAAMALTLGGVTLALRKA